MRVEAPDSSGRESILVVRLGALGDIVHALPAAASLKKSFPDRKLSWVVKPKWASLLTGNPFIDEVIRLENQGSAISLSSWRKLRDIRPTLAVDFQGLLQSAVIGRLARPRTFWGFDQSAAREPLASRFYSHAVSVTGPHRVERNLQLVRSAGAMQLTSKAWLPQGLREGALPSAPFVLASPFAGWAGKEWPLDRYPQIADLLVKEGLALVLNLSPDQAAKWKPLPNVSVHTSSLAGLIDATRRAVAVIGVDSGPLHIAAALDKPGVAVFGPTDPAATGPFGGTIQVVRAPQTQSTYHRFKHVHASMKAITSDQVFAALMHSIAACTVEPS